MEKNCGINCTNWHRHSHINKFEYGEKYNVLAFRSPWKMNAFITAAAAKHQPKMHWKAHSHWENEYVSCSKNADVRSKIVLFFILVAFFAALFMFFLLFYDFFRRSVALTIHYYHVRSECAFAFACVSEATRKSRRTWPSWSLRKEERAEKSALGSENQESWYAE